MPYRDHDHDRLQPPEYPEPDAGDDATAPCPHCRAAIYEDCERCPACGEYLTATAGDKPLWVVLAAAVCLAVAVGWVFVG